MFDTTPLVSNKERMENVKTISTPQQVIMDSFALSPLQPLNLTGNIRKLKNVNILLNYIGDKCITVFNSFNLTNAESKSIKTVIDKFTDHFAPKKHLTLPRHNFFARKQKSDEPFEDYFAAIINLGLQCDLEALREELTKAKIISGLDSKYDDLRTRLMAEEDKTLTLSYVTKYLKTAESSRQAVTQMQKDNRVDVFPMSENILLAKSKGTTGMLDKSNVPVVGSAMIPLVNKNNETKLLEFIVVNVECPPILGLQASIDLNLITYHINMVSDSEPLINKYTDAIKHEFKDLFDGKLGSIPGTISITLDSNAKPVAQPARRIPFGLIDDVKAELARMVTDGNNKPIVYSSRALTKSEQAYCSIEREMLGIVNGCIKLRQFLIGRRIERFDLHVVYKPGKELFIAHALSRAFVDEPVEKEFYTLNEEVICQVNALIENLPIADRSLDKIKNETCKDTELIELKKYITAGWPDNKNKLNQIINPYWIYKEELHIIDDIVFKNTSVVVPKLLRKSLINILHESHVGLHTAKLRTRTKFFGLHMPSPAQLLYSRNLRTRIPVRSEDLKPKVYRLPEKFVRHQDTVKTYYDKRTRSLQPLREGQNIRFQKHQSGHWYAAKVKGKDPQPRSYQIRDHSGNLFTRNRVMINPSLRQSSPTPATPPTNSTLEFPQPVQIHQQIGDSTLQKTAEGKAVKNLDNKITRSGRVVRNPKKLFDD
ncbi:hypothetical protein ILUMI_10466 [Ignelater luminosus]|uniref:Reverse transcriptase RNase H-like domain-containing protein n=1 Tax=Ignelater luminosus TaxID=2038154 RepID=A0A8K0D264_IGNLU|nr:hypothetical protein ILUMI_10466 [Ignelater luminosus]